MPTLNFLRASIVVSCLSAGSFAQAPVPDVPACNPKVAQMLVEQQINESKSVVARPKWVMILLRSADFLWPLDPQAARTYFIEAWSNARAHFAEKGFEKADVQQNKSGGMTYRSIPDPRNDVIRAVGKHDSELAKKFAEEMMADYDKTAADRKDGSTRERDDLLRYAGEIAGTDPELARALYRRLMRYPLSMTWFSSLMSAAGKNQVLADTIYAEALRSYRGEVPSRLLYLSPYPFGAGSPYGRLRSMFNMSPPAGFVPNPELQRAFLDTFFARIASYTENPAEMNQGSGSSAADEGVAMVTAVQALEPIVRERFPEMLERLSSAYAQANSALTADGRKQIETMDPNPFAFSELPFDEGIAQLEEAESKGKLTDKMVAQFIFQRRFDSDEKFAAYERWIAKIKNEKLRSGVGSYFYFLRSQLATKEKRFADGEKWAAKVPELDHRAVLLFEIVKAQRESAGDAASFDTLNSVSKLARSAPNSTAKIRVLFNLSEFYERVNHSTALDELGEAVRVTNQLEDPDLFTNFISRQFGGDDFSFMASIALPGGNFEGMFTALGKKDFEMALSNARSFDDKYFKTIAVIAIAKNCIQPKPEVAKPKK